MRRSIETAMVMAAGLGTRMKPLTNDRCKALVKVGGRTLIDHMLDRLADAGVKRAIVNVHAFADKLEAHLGRRNVGPDIIISDERDQLLETGGGLVKALPLLGADPILICNIDAIWSGYAPKPPSVLSNLIDSWDRTRMDELLLLARRDACLGYDGPGDFDLLKDNHISRRQKAQASWVYAGVQICKPEIAAGFRAEKFSRNLIWDQSLKRRRIFGHVMQAYWMHIGDPKARMAAQAIIDHETVNMGPFV